MAAVKQKTRDKWIAEININERGEPFSFLNEKICYCKHCEKSFTVTKKTQLEQHVETDIHKKHKDLKNKRKASQVHLEDLGVSGTKASRQTILGKELCQAFLSANIPWNKLEDPKIRDVLEKNMEISVPSESTIRSLFAKLLRRRHG